MTINLHTSARAFFVSTLTFAIVGCPSTHPPAENAPVPAEPTSTPPAIEATEEPEAEVSLKFVKPNLSDTELRDGWVSLFDGTTLFGWDVPSETNWHVEDGAIVADSGERSLLLTPFAFDDFQLRCDFHMGAAGNSGVFLRTAEGASNPAKDTYELNICDSHESHKTGSLVGRHIAENVPTVEGDWHTFDIRCEGLHISVKLDGQEIVDFTDQSDAPRSSGRIGLQMNSGRIAFRNIFLRPLQGQALFNGTDLAGLREVPGSKSTFEVEEGAIHVTNGPGFLETEDSFDDFILHVEARVNGEALNSGVFFRAMAGTEKAPSHGYEMQIQNGYNDGDRTKPADSGSGAIFRRAAARYVVANDNEWMVETLIAQGDRFATFVNGYQVVNWQDGRKPDENPRRGQRLKAGHISLQGHDPTTNLDFRALRIHELTSD
ncbi:MAG TPA: DUF1080 domain-containing protein [Planctomycetes bacterium]|nr:DUF1080 domain-containing protein [Fuerstiella sp.]HIK91609.1 DUF1080 domain-containing protein [Planctomycetota bacterium]